MNQRCVCPTVKYAHDVTVSWCYVLPERHGGWIHWESSHTRKETPAEVMRRLYAESRANASQAVPVAA